jgi:hypothetical protein
MRLRLAGIAGLVAAAPTSAVTLDIGDPTMAYFLHERYMLDPNQATSGSNWRRVDSASQLGGELYGRRTLGGSMFGTNAVVAASAYNGGKTFSAEAISPIRGGAASDVIGAWAEVYVAQSFLKLPGPSQLSFTFSAAELKIMDFGAYKGDGWSLYSGVAYEVWAVDHVSGEEFWRESQVRTLSIDYGASGEPQDNTFQDYESQDFTGETGLVGNEPWRPWGCSGCSGQARGIARKEQLSDYTGYVDLSRLNTGREFTVAFLLQAWAVDGRQGETGAMAYVKDPLSSSPASGMSVSGEGLLATNNVLPGTLPIPEPATWALWGLGLSLLGWVARRRTGDGAPARGVRQRSPRWMH